MSERDPRDQDTKAETQPSEGHPSDTGVPQFTSATRYDVGGMIARGGMGEVFAATDRQIKRDVAIKRIRSERTTARGMARFFHEAMIQGRLDHPSILPVHEIGVDPDGRPFFVMKKLAGGTTLEGVIGRRSRERLLRAFVDVCLAVGFAHDKGVVHRDLKPSNIGIDDFDDVYVLDWGIARALDSTDDHGLAGSEDEDDRTAAGALVGTHGYMAPEQIRSASDVDARADVYSLGCILFEILAEERLHPRGSAAVDSTLEGIDARPSARGNHVPPELEAMCTAATALDPGARISSARFLGERVQAFLDGDRDVAQRRELARGHLAAAVRAFDARDTEAGRSTAMREAGRALALDPELAGAADLVTRLMLEPPVVLPPEVERTLVAEDHAILERNAKLGSRAYLVFAAFIPLLIAGGSLEYAISLAVVVAANAALLLLWRPFSTAWAVAVGFSNAALIVIIARMFSPFFIAPGVAAVMTITLVLSPEPDHRSRMATDGRVRFAVFTAMMSAAILGSWLAEELGLTAPTMSMEATSVTFTAPALAMSDGEATTALVLYVLAIVGAAAGIGQAMRRADRTTRRHLHLQTWQLAQLVPRA